MKKLLIILGFISAILAVILAVTPLSNLAIFPIVLGFICGISLLILSKKQNFKAKGIQYILLLVSISLCLVIYKGVFTKTEIGDTQQLEQRDEENLEDSMEQLDDIIIEE